MNRTIIAAQLRTAATRLDKTAWQIESYATALGDTRLLDFVNELRRQSKGLRRKADRIRPRRKRRQRSKAQ